MRSFTILALAFFLIACEGLKNYMNTDLQKCLNCLCHARSGCWSRFNCAKYSIDYDYWKTAKSPRVDTNDEPESESFEKCMKNENCILTTLDQYADAIGHMDCNCDQKFDCKDRAAIHLYGEECANPKFGKRFANNFNHCARSVGVQNMLDSEGSDDCTT